MSNYSTRIALPTHVSGFITEVKRHAGSVVIDDTHEAFVIFQADDEYTLATKVYELQSAIKTHGVSEAINRPSVYSDRNPTPQAPRTGSLRERVVAINDDFQEWRKAQNEYDAPLLGWDSLNELLADLMAIADLAYSELSTLESSTFGVGGLSEKAVEKAPPGLTKPEEEKVVRSNGLSF